MSDPNLEALEILRTERYQVELLVSLAREHFEKDFPLTRPEIEEPLLHEHFLQLQKEMGLAKLITMISMS